MSSMTQTRRQTPVADAQRRAAARNKGMIMRERDEWGARLRDGRASIAGLLTEKPACFKRVLLPNLLLLAPGVANGTLASLNARAVYDGINLMLPLGETPERTIEWLIAHVDGRDWRREKHPCGCEKSQIADRLDEAIREHRAMVTGEDEHGQVNPDAVPASMFGNADDVLYRAHQRALNLRRSLGDADADKEPMVDSAPFRAWVGQQLQLLATAPSPEDVVSAPIVALAGRLNISTRQLNRYQRDPTLRLSTVDRALTNFGHPALLNDLYPLAEVA